ncbi:MAG: hypothetical protein ACK41U_12435 [Paracoccus sp. (in: a-proteobacteria)]|uniref:hypothetical protein n=1 Tax=Paracoccus sp. TaxID=267 RepID=UPI00391BBD3A
MPLTETDRDDITAAIVGVIDRYCGMDPIDMPLARELTAEVCRIIDARERGRNVLPVQMPYREAPKDMPLMITDQDGRRPFHPGGAA